MSIISIGIEMNEAVKAAIVKHDKSGKSFLNLTVQKRKEPSEWGESHFVALSQTKAQREAKEPKVFVGGGKEYVFQDRQVVETQEEDSQDLPF